MPENHTPVETEHDPSASTQMFRAFVDDGESEAAHQPRVGGRTLLIVAGLILLLAVIAGVSVL